MKILREGSGMKILKYIKYESKGKEEQQKIEYALVEKMAKWKYDPNEIKAQAPDVQLKEIT